MYCDSLGLDSVFFLAPMSGITDRPMRTICRDLSCGLVYTEMVSANALVRHNRRTAAMINITAEEHPVALQIFGAVPEIMAVAAAKVETAGADVVDLNLGCPMPKVVKTGAGAALLKDLSLAQRIIAAVRRAVQLPLTVKIRSGWDAEHPVYLEMGKIAEQEGANAVIFHPRHRMQVFSGRADWNMIAQLKNALHIPVIGNGDVRRAEDGILMMKQTGCDGVMVGRGALGHPWIFNELKQAAAGQTPLPISLSERQRVMEKHLRLAGDNRQDVLIARKHLAWYSAGLPESAAFRRRLFTLGKAQEIAHLLSQYFETINRYQESCSIKEAIL